jgi:beta-glucosidase
MSFLRLFFVLASAGLILGKAGADTFTPPSSTQLDPKIEERVNGLLSQMTQEEKIGLISGPTYMNTQAIPRLGIPTVKFSDGPFGVRCWGKSTAYPTDVVLAASWDRDAAVAMGTALAHDARARGVNLVLGPAANIYREAQCGRNFEYLGEDPYLASAMAVGYIRGMQAQGVAACIKHYAVNEEETQRESMNMIVSQRALREIYLPPFKAAIEEGGAWTAMAAYNKVNGPWCTADKFLLTDVLRDEWHFAGVLMSDWGATHDTLGPLNAGLDLEMNGSPRKFYNMEKIPPLLASGQVTQATLDEHVRRILRMIVSMGFMDRPPNDAATPLDDPDSANTAQRIASEGIVLLKNQNNFLPLDRDKIHQLVVMGPNASPAVIGGGGSGGTEPFSSVSVLQGLQSVAGGNVQIHYIASGMNSLAAKSVYSPQGDPQNTTGLSAEYFNNSHLDGAPVTTQVDPKIDFNWHEDPPVPAITGAAYSIRWKGTITPQDSGDYAFVASSDDGSRVYLDGKEIIDLWSPHPLEGRSTALPLEKGHTYALTVEYFNSAGGGEMHFGWGKQEISAEDKALISAADAVVYAGGLNPHLEHEASDRPWGIPTDQDLEISQVAELNPHLIVSINAGGNLGMKKSLDKIPALIWSWYPGENGNTSLAKIIFGDLNPSGRLPDSFEKKFEDAPAYGNYPGDSANGGSVNLAEGIYVGYRWFDKKKIEPAFPFGFGLSYTTFDLKNPQVTSEGQGTDRRLTVSVQVTNSGKRDGAEVVQLYVRPVKSTIDRAPQELKGFERVELKAGETKTVTLPLAWKDFAYYDEKSSAWAVAPGTYQLALCRSSRDTCGSVPVTW